MHIFTGIYTYPQAESQCLHGISSFYVGMPILIVRMGKILICLHGVPIFTAGCPYLLWKWAPGCLYSRKYRHRDAYFYVKIVIRDAYIWGCLYSLDTGSPTRRLCRCALIVTAVFPCRRQCCKHADQTKWSKLRLHAVVTIVELTYHLTTTSPS